MQSAESPCKRMETPPKPKKVGISQIASVVAEVYGSRLVAGPGVEQPTIPLQQKLLICTFLLMTKERNTKEVVLGKVKNLKENLIYSNLGSADNYTAKLLYNSHLEDRWKWLLQGAGHYVEVDLDVT